jgi:hypothetical protein
MKKIKVNAVLLIVAGSVILSGCETIKKTSTAMGSIGTGVLAGAASGIGTGILCDQLTHGKSTAGCIAAGMAVGALVGYWAKSLDEEAEKAVPAMDCSSIKRRMNYPATANLPKALLTLTAQPGVIKPGEKLTIPLKMDLATPGEAGKEQEIPIKFDTTSGTDHYTGKAITKACGGDYPLPLTLSAEKEGVYNTTIKLLNASDNLEIEGGVVTFCYTVASDGINKCGAAVSPAPNQKPIAPSKKQTPKKASTKK